MEGLCTKFLRTFMHLFGHGEHGQKMKVQVGENMREGKNLWKTL